MAFTRRLPQIVDPAALVCLPLELDEPVLIHRYPQTRAMPHMQDDPNCWCSPILTTVGELRHWPVSALQARLDTFLCVH